MRNQLHLRLSPPLISSRAAKPVLILHRLSALWPLVQLAVAMLLTEPLLLQATQGLLSGRSGGSNLWTHRRPHPTLGRRRPPQARYLRAQCHWASRSEEYRIIRRSLGRVEGSSRRQGGSRLHRTSISSRQQRTSLLLSRINRLLRRTWQCSHNTTRRRVLSTSHLRLNHSCLISSNTQATRWASLRA